MKNRRLPEPGAAAQGLLFVLLVAAAGPMPAQEGAPASWDRVSAIFAASCAECHDWAASPSGILGQVVPGKPDSSLALLAIEAGRMPPGDSLSAEDRRAIRLWIAAGAPQSPSGPSASAPAPGQASPGVLPPAIRKAPSIETHMVSGFLAGGFILAAGVAGTWHLVDLIEAGHAYRDSIGFPESGASPSQLALRSDYIAALWASPKDQALRWTHLGFLAIGGAFYAYNAVTGLEMLRPEDRGLSKRDLHRYAFFAHGAMMAAEAVLGFFTTEALKRGDHDSLVALAAAHGAIGIAAPVTMIGSGLLFTIKLY